MKTREIRADLALLRLAGVLHPNDLQSRPSLRPNRVYPIAAASVVVAHVLVFAAFVHGARPTLTSLGTIDAELVPEGDFFEAEAISESDLVKSEPEPAKDRSEESEIVAPPVAMPVLDAPLLPAKKKVQKALEKLRPKPEKKNQERPNGSERREAQAARRYGVAGGRGGPGAGASQATCLAHVAAALRSHTPGSTSLGPGTALVKFHINAGGGISVVSASGTTPAHAALGRRIVSSSRGPSTCGAAFVSQNVYFD